MRRIRRCWRSQVVNTSKVIRNPGLHSLDFFNFSFNNSFSALGSRSYFTGTSIIKIGDVGKDKELLMIRER